jgi:SAM-dependent methyltransferase
MEKMRTPFQGVWNIIRFNWHFYAASLLALLCLFVLSMVVNTEFSGYLRLFAVLISLPTAVSLLVSYYIYDLSNLYDLPWIAPFEGQKIAQIININAGFDETTALLQRKFPAADCKVFDFYDPTKHTEISIERARKAYPPFPNTINITTDNLPVPEHSADKIFIIFAAHEIRNEQERIVFLKNLKRILKPTGEIVITEHLRDMPNFLAYTIGFLHFYSKTTWLRCFEAAGLTLKSEQKHTPFISIFTLTQ